MCGIVGAVSSKEVAGVLVDALRRLEYRGYDSAGIATLAERAHRAAPRRRQDRPAGACPRGGAARGAYRHRAYPLGDARGAERDNAHPHLAGRVAVVHNGIIENFQALRRELEAAGHAFATETDTEVVPHLVDDYMRQGLPAERAAMEALRRLEGAFGVVLLFEGMEDMLVVARKGSPLAIGHGEGEMFVGSNAVRARAADAEDPVSRGGRRGDRAPLGRRRSSMRRATPPIVRSCSRPCRTPRPARATIGTSCRRRSSSSRA